MTRHRHPRYATLTDLNPTGGYGGLAPRVSVAQPVGGLAPHTPPGPVKPPAPTAWVGVMDCQQEYLAGSAAFFPVFDYKPFGALAKGCVLLNVFVDAGPSSPGNSGEMEARVFIWDGSVWSDTAAGFVTPGHPQSAAGFSGSVSAWFNGPTAVADARGFAFSKPGEMVAAAAADGVHMFVVDGNDNVTELTAKYPAGVTQADLPPSKNLGGAPVSSRTPKVTKKVPWLVTATDGLHQLDAAGALATPVTFPEPPFAGCVILTFTTNRVNEYRYQCLVFDGTRWWDHSPLETVSQPVGVHCYTHKLTSMDPGYLSVSAWFTGSTAVADAKAILFGNGQLSAAAAPDGIHLFCRNSDGAIQENVEPYPAGVTQAEMPTSRIFIPAPAKPRPPKAATTPNAAAWVGGVTDVARMPNGAGGFDTPLPATPAPVKGCVYLSFIDDGGGNVVSNAFIHDGKGWQAPQAMGFTVPEAPQNPGAPDAPQIKAYYFGDSNAAKNWSWDAGDELTASAEADGIHLFSEDERGGVTENTVPYPAGVTMADMPASKTF